MTTFKRIFLVSALGALLALPGCGGDEEGEPIPAQTAQALQTELDGVQARLDNGTEGACRDILEGSRGPNMERVNQLIQSMPDDLDADVRSALEDSFDQLWELVEQDCDDKAAEEESQPEPEPEPTPTETTETEPVPPETDTETQPEPVPTTPEEAPLPPEGNGNNGGAVPDEGNGGGGVGPSSKPKKEKEE
jgi:hypothetical protein